MQISSKSIAYFLIFTLGMSIGCTTSIPEQSEYAIPGKDFILSVVPNKVEAYPDEEIMLRYELLFRRDGKIEGFENQGRFIGFWSQSSPDPMGLQKLDGASVIRDQQKYNKATFHKKAIFAMQAGDYIIDPGEIRLSYNKKAGTSGNRGRVNLIFKTLPLKIHIKTFPEDGMPANFTGTCGNYSLTARIQDDKQAQSGKIIVEAVIEGEGNLWSLKPPDFHLGNDLKLLTVDEVVKTRVSWDHETITGNKIFTFTFISTKKGQVELPVFSFSFFDPHRNQYQTVTSQKLITQVNTLNFNITNNKSERMNDNQSAIVILLDGSASMLTQDMLPKDRFSAAREALKKVTPAMNGYYIGLKIIGPEVVTARPISSIDKEYSKLLDNLEATVPLNGTATGSAIYEGVKELIAVGPSAKKKNIILITDGGNNGGFIDPYAAAQIARQKNVSIFTVAIGRNGLVPFPYQPSKNVTQIIQISSKIESKMLQDIAETSGGKYFRATDTDQLDGAMKTIIEIISTP